MNNVSQMTSGVSSVVWHVDSSENNMANELLKAHSVHHNLAKKAARHHLDGVSVITP